MEIQEFTRKELKNVARVALCELSRGDHTIALGMIDWLKEQGLDINRILRMAYTISKIDRLILANTYLDIKRASLSIKH